MRVCEKHLCRATETLKSLRDGTEYDLCSQCLEELREILFENPPKEPKEEKRGRKRVITASN